MMTRCQAVRGTCANPPSYRRYKFSSVRSLLIHTVGRPMDAQQELLHSVFAHFQKSGEWPQATRLQIKLRHLGNIAKIAAEVGPQLIICERSSQGGVCRLTLKGVASCKGSDLDIQHFLWAVRALAARYLESEANDDFPLSDVVASLSLSDVELRRLGELVYDAPGIWRSIGRHQSGDVFISPSHRIWYLDDVQTLSDFYSALKRAEEDEMIANRNQFRMWSEATPQVAPVDPASDAQASSPEFVHHSRLDNLRAITHPSFDLRRLIALCEELNICAENRCIFATAMLTRAVMDHVPPVFEMKSFAEVANNYPGAKSFKESMNHLSNSARKIADAHLHLQIRNRESLPTPTQVNFSRELDVLLSEVVRILS